MTKFQIATYFEVILGQLPEDVSVNNFEVYIGDNTGKVLINEERMEDTETTLHFRVNQMYAAGNPMAQFTDKITKDAMKGTK